MSIKKKIAILASVICVVIILLFFLRPEDPEELRKNFTEKMSQLSTESLKQTIGYYSSRITSWYSSKAVLDAKEYGSEYEELKNIISNIPDNAWTYIDKGACCCLAKDVYGAWTPLFYFSKESLNDEKIEKTNRSVFFLSIMTSRSPWDDWDVLKESLDNDDTLTGDLIDMKIFPPESEVVKENKRPSSK